MNTIIVIKNIIKDKKEIDGELARITELLQINKHELDKKEKAKAKNSFWSIFALWFFLHLVLEC